MTEVGDLGPLLAAFDEMCMFGVVESERNFSYKFYAAFFHSDFHHRRPTLNCESWISTTHASNIKSFEH
jgi:hypothetical protein